MGNWMIGANVDVKSFVGEQMFQDKIFPKLAEGKANVFPFLFRCSGLSPSTKADDQTPEISHAMSWEPHPASPSPWSNGC